MQKIIFLLLFVLIYHFGTAQNRRIRDYGVEIGVMDPGPYNSITDVDGVKVGHTTLIKGDSIRTGVTAILPHTGNIFKKKVPAAIYIGNGFGKLAGYTQVKELGNIETPIVLTNTLSVPTASNALITYTLNYEAKEKGLFSFLKSNKDEDTIRSVNSVVGETNDGYLNNIRGRHVKEQHVLDAIKYAKGGFVPEGNVGAGTGTICFGFKGGIGTASRVLKKSDGGYVVGVLVQTNFGGVLEIAGVPIAKELDIVPKHYTGADGSCMIVVLTNAPLDARNLERLAKRAMLGLAKTGGIASNGSGDYVIAGSTAKENLIDHSSKDLSDKKRYLRNGAITPLFLATIEATEEAILNTLFMAETMTGRANHKIEALPILKVLDLLKQYNRL